MEYHSQAEFIDTGAAPELFADGLHDVEVIGHNCRFMLFQYRRSSGGVWFKEPAFFARIPCDAVGPAIALTIRKGGASIIIPAATGAMKEFARAWVH